MSAKTPTQLLELIQELRVELTRLMERVDHTRESLDTANIVGLRERLAVVEALVADLQKRQEESDRRRWQFWLGVGTVVLTFAANLTVNLLVLFAKK